MEGQLCCPLCNFQYGQQKTPRILGMCGHTYCESCIETMILGSGQNKYKIICPQDDITGQLSSNSVGQFPVNKALLRIAQSNMSKSSLKDSSFDVSKIVKEEQVQQDEEAKELITAIKQSQQQQIQPATQQIKEEEGYKQMEQSYDQEDQNMCLLHQKPLEIVCVVDLQKICVKCAIFGEHKGHQFKSIQQIQQQNDAFYHQLLAVYDQKTEIMVRVQKKVTKTDLLAILNSNKQSLTKQIKQRFKKLMDTIKTEQKKTFTKLQKIIQKVEKDIDGLYRIQPQTIQKYEEWQRKSFQKLQIIQKGTFEEKLQLLLIDQAKKDRNIIIQGKSLIENIKHQEDNIINKAQAFLSSIKMRTNDKVFQYTQNFVQVFDKPQQPSKLQIKEPQQLKINGLLQIEPMLPNESPKNLAEDDLLQLQEHAEDSVKHQKIAIFSQPIQKVQDIIQDVMFVPSMDNRFPTQNSNRKEVHRSTKHIPNQDFKLGLQSSQDTISQFISRQSSFITQKMVRPTKKKLKSIKIPQKYEKILQSLYADSADTLDLTNAELGDNIIQQICQFIPGTKIKAVKLIRNKLTDDSIVKILPFLSNVITLNLSQNLLTQRVLDIFIENREMLPKVKSIILSLNKIIERKHKSKIDQLRKFEITVSV